MTTMPGAIPLLLYLALGASAGAVYSETVPGPDNATGLGSLPSPVGEVHLAPPALVRLARSMGEADAIARWDFADTLLDVLLETYRDELMKSYSERIGHAGRAARLARWQTATAHVVDDLVAARRALGEGADPTVQVDATGQVLLFIGRLPVVFSPPRPGTEDAMMDRAVVRYCARHRCEAVLSDAIASSAIPAPRGSWTLRQGMLPVYAIDNRLSCTFADLSQREVKAQHCEAAAVEAERLHDGIAAASRLGVAVDWTWMAGHPPTTSTDVVVRLQPEGRYLRLSLPMLTRLTAADWRRLILALSPDAAPPAREPVIEEGERLLDSHRR